MYLKIKSNLNLLNTGDKEVDKAEGWEVEILLGVDWLQGNSFF